MIALLIALMTSIALFGVLRTSIWVIPCVIWIDAQPSLAMSVISFLLVASWIVPYRDGGFDARNLPKEKLALLFFLSGVLTGLATDASHLAFFIVGALYPFLMIRIWALLRMPLVKVHFRSIRWRWALLVLFIIALVLQRYLVVARAI